MSKIQWTEQTCNAIIGCSKVSAGCQNCYAEKMANRLAWMGNTDYLKVVGALAYETNWNGHTRFVESALDKVLKRKRPTMYFMSSMGDMFHKSVPFEWVDKVWAVMRQCGQHTFQVLTKRPERMAEYLSPENDRYTASKIADLLPDGYPGTFDVDMYWPLDNVWLGTTVEHPDYKHRIDELRKIPAVVRFLSLEPLLADLGELNLDGIGWVICGCESGPGARAMLPHWAREIRDQCKAAGVAFFMKQLRIDGKLIKDINQFPKDLRIREYPTQ